MRSNVRVPLKHMDALFRFVFVCLFVYFYFFGSLQIPHIHRPCTGADYFAFEDV